MNLCRIPVSFGRGKDKRTRLVLVDRGHAPRTRRTVRRMLEAGMPLGRIAAALRIDQSVITKVARRDPVWSDALRGQSR
jgi:hypothetical protein